MKLDIPPQIPRLAIAFTIFIILFLFIRHLLIPDTFGEFGHYRGDALIDNANIEIHYAGQQACFECHQDIEDGKTMDAHNPIHCETCHGPGQKHVSSSLAADIFKPSTREFCGSCHSLNAAKRQSAIYQVNLSEHNVDKKCIDCHNPHQPWDMKE
jgi:hypothetical protein